jgi:surfeit locus 1 family protein
MKSGSLKFKLGWVPTLAAVAMMLLTAYLGNWQLNRADIKTQLQARYDAMQRDPATVLPGGKMEASALLYRKVELRGQFDLAHQIYIDNRIHDGVAGYYIVVPFHDRLSGTNVLVNRGWLSAGSDRSYLPPVLSPQGEVHIEGIVVNPVSRYLELSKHAVQGRVWENLDYTRFVASLPYAIQPIIVMQLNDTGDKLIREWDRPDAGAAMHMGYAVQWFGLTAAILIIYVVLNVKRRFAK